MSGGFLETILAFMDKGGNVLWLIAILLFVMWTLIFERLWFFNFVWRKEVFDIISAWEGRAERKSWYAKQVRQRLLSMSREDINTNLNLITTLVALCPLLGLLGTVTGMIEVFNVMAVTGGGDAKSMAGGVERATDPDHGRHGGGPVRTVCQHLSTADCEPRAGTARGPAHL
jgi:biopolymer transport protein ExbB